MPALGPTSNIKYDVEIQHVREVTLAGSADRAYWSERLGRESLYPAIDDGRAQLLLCAVEAKFMGLRFREFSISVFTSRQEGGAARDGAFLVHAFNSRRFFAWVERIVFRTPYYFARLRVHSATPAIIEVADRAGALCAARMGSPVNGAPREPIRHGAEGWAGPVYLPGNRSTDPSHGRLFFARIGGPTHVYSFDSNLDEFSVRPATGVPALRSLIDSHFRVTQWHIREGATHGKSKTIRRGAW